MKRESCESRLVHRDLQHHLHPAIKAVNTTPATRPSERRLAGRSDQIKRARIAVERELGLALYCKVEKLPDRTEVSDSEMKAMWSSISKAWFFT